MLKTIIEKLIWLYIFLLPLQTVFIFDEQFINGAKWQYGSGVIYATEILLITILILSLFLIIKLKKTKFQSFFKRENLTQKIFIICLWSLIAWSGLSIFWSQEKSVSFYLWFKLLEGSALFLVIITLAINKNKILWPLSLTTALQGVLAFWQFITQSIIANKWLGIATHGAERLGDIVIENSDGRWLRAYGTFNHPNILGGFCVLGLLASLELSRSANKRQQVLLMILSIFSTVGIFFSFSRSAWLATIISMIIVIIKNIKEKNYLEIKTLLASLAIGIFLIIIFFNFIIIRSDFSNRLEKKSLNDRGLQITESLKLFQTFNQFGVGINNYTVALNHLYPNSSAYSLQPVHNLYLLILTELGYIGLISFLLLIILTFIRSQNLKEVVWLVPLLIISLLDHYLWTQYVGIILFWLILTKIELSVKVLR